MKDDILAALGAVLDADHAQAVLDHRKTKKCALTVFAARAAIDYRPETGEFIRRSTGLPCDCDHTQGYKTVMVEGKSYLAHRLAWFLVNGEWPADQLDHIDRDRANNRLSNLRPCTNQQNCWNMQRQPGSSGVRGVHWDRQKCLWMATMRVEGKTKYLGRFKDIEDAAAAYSQAEKRHRGDFLEVNQ